MGSASPIKQAAYRLAPSEQEFLQEEVRKMLNMGLIRKSYSPWSSSVVLVPKKNRKLRFRLGQWFNVMPFGLCNTPATFQQLMNHVLKEYIGQFVAVYLDDITVYSRTFWEHIKHLERVFIKLQGARLKLNSDKCYFLRKSLKVLGYEITRNGIRLDNEKVIKVQKYPALKTLLQLRGFLENKDYEENYEDEGDYESEVEEINYERTDSIEEQWNTGHESAGTRNGKGAEILLSQDEVYLVDDLRAIQKVIEASEEENDPKYKGDEGSSNETSDDDESQIEVVINSRSTSLTTPEEETLTEEWKVNKSFADQVKQENAMMDEFIKWPEDDQEETFELQAIDIGTEGIGKTQRFENEFFLYDHPTLNDYIAAWELNLREAIYWVDFYGYSLIANDPNELLILQNRIQDEVQQSEARLLIALQTGIDPGCDRRLVDDNGVLILSVEIELD
ncbi:14001_t:CDS:2 [Dentiscutata erythropus]|uniref:14001_t:CDS:1 n=1 Tax=Dentiscutata erythropus TaxID=1348616 RepID=A0A9N9NBD5_9GLOM|nr:14001_t:CDS:2 [Dentiscutata erythropus]